MKLFLPCLLLLLSNTVNVLAQPVNTSAKAANSCEVYFDFGKHDLRHEADSVLAQLATFAKGKQDYTVRITAHTDSIGSLANNMALSERRANAVMDFLVRNGLDAGRISFAYFGEKSPISINSTEEGRQLNRRATVEVLLPMPMALIEGQVTDENTGLPLVADVVFRSKEASDTIKTGTDGRFSKSVPIGTVLGIDAYASCYFLKTEMVKADKKSKTVPMPLRPAKAGSVADIQNLYFVGDQPILLESSKPELPKILRFMEQNPTMKIEIAGHVNLPNRPPVTKTSWEYRLSERRAMTIYNYLLENGISKDRISWKGYGNHEMVFPHATEEVQQARNRRVELRVLEGCE